MIPSAELIEKLKSLVSVPIQTFPAVVSTVEPDNLTCEVESDGVTWYDVRIQSLSQAGKGITILPKKDSFVLVSRIGNSNELFISAFSEIDQVLFEIENTSFKATNEGVEIVKENKTTFLQNDLFTIKTANESLKKILEDLIAAIGALTVTTGVGPSGIPINKVQFDAIKTRIGNLLSE
jgi:hypothetical protein